jgi:hypothetical protein
MRRAKRFRRSMLEVSPATPRFNVMGVAKEDLIDGSSWRARLRSWTSPAESDVQLSI